MSMILEFETGRVSSDSYLWDVFIHHLGAHVAQSCVSLELSGYPAFGGHAGSCDRPWHVQKTRPL